MQVVDDRWNSSGKTPLSNGLQHLTTPPATVSRVIPVDGRIFEFLLPYPMHIVDEEDWPPLKCRTGNCDIEIRKPIRAREIYGPSGQLGNERLNAHAFVIHVFASPKAGIPYPTAEQVWPAVEMLIEWVRVKARHYWLLHGTTGYDASLFRGSVITRNNDNMLQTNFGAFGGSAVVRPLSRDLWLTIEKELNEGVAPPVSEAIFCDALLSLSGNDEVKAALEAGVACEIEITQLLDEVVGQPPLSQAKSSYASRNSAGKYPRFGQKLNQWTVKLGLLDPNLFPGDGTLSDWPNVVEDLYKVRNSVAHSGKLDGKSELIRKYLIAANALFKYSRAARQAAGLRTYSMPSVRESAEQLVCIVGRQIHSTTGGSVVEGKAL